MNFNKYKNIKINKDLKLKKEVLIGCAAIATVSTVALVCHKVSKKKRDSKKSHKNEDLTYLIDELENISSKIVEISHTQEQLDTLMKEKVLLKDNFTFNPY